MEYYRRLPIGVRAPLEASVTLLEATTPVTDNYKIVGDHTVTVEDVRHQRIEIQFAEIESISTSIYRARIMILPSTASTPHWQELS